MQTVIKYPGKITDASSMQPAVAVIMPFEPHLRSKAELHKQFDEAVNKVTSYIRENYQHELGKLVLMKLKKLISQLNFNSFKKSVAIYVSPVFEKILYLPFPVETQVTIDAGFNIRDIAAAKKENKSFLLVNLSRYASSIYSGDENGLMRVNLNTRGQTDLFPIPSFPKEDAFTDRNDLREELLEDFLRQTDQALHLLLQAYPLPVLISGSPKILGGFRKISRNANNIVHYIHGHFVESSTAVLKQILQPVLRAWDQIRLKELQQKIEAAANSRHLAVGIRDVWKQARAHNASLLIVERDFSAAAFLHPQKGEGDNIYDQYSLVNNTVDDIIENVLECGGDIKIVEPGSLEGYDPIILIERYSSGMSGN